MKRLSAAGLFAGVAVVFCLMAQPMAAQGQGGGGGGGGQGGGGGRGGPGGGGRNFDPEQIRQRMMDNYRERLGVKGDDEWKLISERITKVNDARRAVGGGFGGMRGFGRPGGQGGGGPGGDQPAAQGGNQNRRGGFGGEQSVAEKELQDAVEGNASADTIKAKLANYRSDRKTKQAALEKAQESLREVLSVKQEAMAVLAGLLN